MKSLVITTFVIHLFFYFINLTYCDDSNLISVVVIYRHGDRTPVRPYPNDPYKNSSYWPVGFGQLTNLGKQQHFALGKWLRNRYSSFLPEKYSEKDIRIKSTDVDRTLMSAESNLAGLYPPRNNQIWNQNLQWQPIPIHTTPELEDPILAMKKQCPKYNLLLAQLLKSSPFININRRNHDLYAYLTRYTGSLVNSLETLEYVYNTLYIEKLNNFTLPNWTIPIFPKKMKEFADLSFVTGCYNQDLSRLKIGPLFNELLDNFNNAINCFKNSSQISPKFWMYSAHDTTIANTLNALGAFKENAHCPPYASTVIFELKFNKKFYIEIFYKNSSVPRKIFFNGCSNEICTYDAFVNYFKPIVLSVKEWEKECKLNVLSVFVYADKQSLFEIVSLISLLIILIGFITAFVCHKYQKERQVAYLRLPEDEIAA